MATLIRNRIRAKRKNIPERVMEANALVLAQQSWSVEERVFYIVITLFITALIILLFSIEKD